MEANTGIGLWEKVSKMAVELPPIHDIILTKLPIVAVIIFLFGLLLRIISWQRGFPQFRPPLKPTLKDIFATTKHLARKDLISTWLLLWPLHITFLVIFFRHLRSIGIWKAEWFTSERYYFTSEHFLTQVLPNVMGLVFLAAILIFLFQRLVSTNMRIPATRVGDYLFIILIVIIGITGMAMRFLPHQHEVLSFQIVPYITMTVDSIPNLNILAIHALVSELFIMYIPFSRLMHIITGLFT